MGSCKFLIRICRVISVLPEIHCWRSSHVRVHTSWAQACPSRKAGAARCVGRTVRLHGGSGLPEKKEELPAAEFMATKPQVRASDPP